MACTFLLFLDYVDFLILPSYVILGSFITLMTTSFHTFPLNLQLSYQLQTVSSQQPNIHETPEITEQIVMEKKIQSALL